MSLVASGSLLISIDADLNAQTGSNKTLGNVESTDAHEKACLEFPNGREEYLSRT